MLFDLVKMQEFNGAIPCLFRLMSTDEYGTSTCLYACKALIPSAYDYIKNGVYACQLTKSSKITIAVDYNAYEITGIKGHTKILIHNGNKKEHSRGCLLLGKQGELTDYVYASKNTFIELYKVLKEWNGGQLPREISLFVNDYKHLY